MVFKYHLPGHIKNPEECCCGEAPDFCLPYVSCCLRDMVAQVGILVTEVDPDFPDDPDSGDLTEAYLSEFKFDNNCNSQTSVDWSSWQFLDSDGAGGEVTLTISGASFQGCTFGVDVEPEHIFCDCGNWNFETRYKFCNPSQTESIRIRPRQPSLTVGYGGPSDPVCALLPDPTPIDPLGIVIAPGGEGEFIWRFRKADFRATGCIEHCYRNGPRAILEGPTFYNDGYNFTCLEPITCIGDDSSIIFTGQAIDDCDYPDCPPCGCVSDDGCPTCCSCGCDGVEAMNSCAPPKMLCSCSEDSGSVTVCESINQGFGVGERLIFCIDDNCQVTAIIGRVFTTRRWQFVRFGNPGASVLVDMAGLDVNCADYDVEWSISGGNISLTIDGNNQTQPLPPGYNPRPAGTCWITADDNARFTVK